MLVLRSTQAQETRETYVQAGTTTPDFIYLFIYMVAVIPLDFLVKTGSTVQQQGV